jgi:hypothetical protein
MFNLVRYKEFPVEAYSTETCGYCKEKFVEPVQEIEITEGDEIVQDNETIIEPTEGEPALDLNDKTWAHKSMDGQSYQCFFHKRCFNAWTTFQEQQQNSSKFIDRCPSCTKGYTLILMSSKTNRIIYNIGVLCFNALLGGAAGMMLTTGAFLFNRDKLHAQIANPYYGMRNPQVSTLAELQAFQEAAKLTSEAASLLAVRVIAAAGGIVGLIVSRLAYTDMTTKQKLIELSPLIAACGITYLYTGNILEGFLSVIPYAVFAGAVGGFIGGIKYTCELD